MGPQLDSCGRPHLHCASRRSPVSLQWGRNLIVAEGISNDAKPVDSIGASMGPQLDSCGRELAARYAGATVGASMGPQLDSCGRRTRAYRYEPRICWASMGPQLDSCGRPPWAGFLQKYATLLQWGRNLIVAEGWWGGGNGAGKPASMGPQLDSCGRPDIFTRLRRARCFNGAAT